MRRIASPGPGATSVRLALGMAPNPRRVWHSHHVHRNRAVEAVVQRPPSLALEAVILANESSIDKLHGWREVEIGRGSSDLHLPRPSPAPAEIAIRSGLENHGGYQRSVDSAPENACIRPRLRPEPRSCSGQPGRALGLSERVPPSHARQFVNCRFSVLFDGHVVVPYKSRRRHGRVPVSLNGLPRSMGFYAPLEPCLLGSLAMLEKSTSLPEISATIFSVPPSDST